MPGQVMAVYVKEGDEVQAGQPLLLLEAMKMEMRVAAPAAGVVRRLLVEPGQAVERGQQLVEVESTG
ncbi:MAG: acetyl-CoA carboxylase biotin carboxyl carrier protein subunit [Chloroflexi bacterium]|nr:acetyl-CoA carboxylase biotin carboxyl carrier protein subunit [Chloroflexota bacterium]